MAAIHLVIISLFLWITKSGGGGGEGEEGSHETKAIDDYCDAWKDFDNGQDWDDDWGSIDFEDDDEEISTVTDSISPLNIYDTYYASECRRIRRPWNTMSSEDRQLYMDGLLELRKRGELKMELDEFVAVGSVHDDHFGSVTHHDSDYLFWHGYLVWELESRIRNLGGKFSCFGMPYWDITNEYYHEEDLPAIFSTGLGGYGDPNDAWRVNGYSWDVTTKEFWSPDHNFVCTAKDDACPICSVKRDADSGFNGIEASDYYGTKIVELPDFVDFQQWLVGHVGLPPSIDNSYDPIWYLFHSFESYMQALWVNCHDYDLIESNDLFKYPSAFSPYCDPDDEHIGMTVDDCVGIDLEDDLYFNGLLPKREWSYVHDKKLNIKKLYSLPQWNIIYDLENDDFWERSGLSEQCKGKMNKEWFILSSSTNNMNKNLKDEKEQEIYKNESFLNGLIPLNNYQMITIIAIISFVILTVISIFRNKMNKHSKLLHTKNEYSSSEYGSV